MEAQETGRQANQTSPNYHREFTKSASYTYLPHVKASPYSTVTPITIKGEVSAEDLVIPLDNVELSSPDSSGWTTPSEEIKASTVVLSDVGARLDKIPDLVDAEVSSTSDQISTDDSSANEVDSVVENPIEETVKDVVEKPLPPRPSLARRLSRRVSALSSRSPSPTKESSAARSTDQAIDPPKHAQPPRLLLRKRSYQAAPAQTEYPAPLSKPQAPQRGLSSSVKDVKTRPPPDKRTSVALGKNLLKSFSSDRLFTISDTPAEELAPLPAPRPLNLDDPATVTRVPRKRDELWNVFRQLDGDFAKFCSKSTPFRANVIRQSLLPFLRSHANDAPDSSLRAEDLDRRVIILNKWWMGLLDLLQGKGNQSLSGTDRPTILDALSGLMDRPEWRPYPSPFCPLSRKTDGSAALPRTKSVASLASIGSEFLTESVMLNVQNLFVQNLHTQMTYVVEKLSLRNASASLIAFCGKAIAYAFFFCPGIGDALIQLWHLEPDSLKRVLKEYGLSRMDNLKAESDHIVSAFPPAVQNLAFVSLTATSRYLRRTTDTSATAAKLQWYGYWFDRWRGRESDLLYVFVKNYFILVNDYLPDQVEDKYLITAPAMLLVQAQLLSSLDSTMHRHSVAAADGVGQPPSSFDDILDAPDAVVSAIPLLPPNAVRTMVENRLIMLVRGFLCDRLSEHHGPKRMFAAVFSKTLHAAASGISVYDQHSCITLCDFLEEALPLLIQFDQNHPGSNSMVDSEFWADVCRRMINSQNTTTEMRLYVLLYTIWDHLCVDVKSKEDFGMNLLLDPSIFNAGFTHWFPVVRAYFMRLVCWRLGRHNGEASELDARILSTLFERLKQLWSSHLYTLEQAEADVALAMPSTAPCHPMPGRRFMIVRLDNIIAPAGAFMSFNGVRPSMSIGPRTHSDIGTGRPPSVDSNDSDGLSIRNGGDDTLGLRGFLRGIMGTNKKRSPTKELSSSPFARDASTGGPPARGRLDLLNPGEQPSSPRTALSARRLSAEPSPLALNQKLNFKFSLEYASRPPGHTIIGPMRDMRLSPPRLPAAAMKFLLETGGRVPTIRAERPDGASGVRPKYVGRALAEWAILIAECQNFFDRRRLEGVACDLDVETPTLAVEVIGRRGG